MSKFLYTFSIKRRGYFLLLALLFNLGYQLGGVIHNFGTVESMYAFDGMVGWIFAILFFEMYRNKNGD
jgi:hypothetical protein